VLLGIALASLALPASTQAHGPCNCSFPQLGEPGARVTTRSPAYKIVFNPRPGDYVSEMNSTGYASAYQPAAPTTTVMSRSVDNPVRRASYRVPEAPPGVYLVLTFDGSEGARTAPGTTSTCSAPRRIPAPRLTAPGLLRRPGTASPPLCSRWESSEG